MGKRSRKQNQFKSERLNQHLYFMKLAHLVSQRSACVRRQVGCIFVNHRNHVLATGYNGPPAKFPHCTEKTCLRTTQASGTAIEKCRAIHAEINAIIQCTDCFDIKIAYVTDSPCLICIRALLNTSCETIIFNKLHGNHDFARDIWLKGIFPHEWIHFETLKIGNISD